ncbi:uncharacterized protein BJ171DRAFT_474291 [Polychytrium aggregatum]|uniref:uncharacterized protein n=1 Tax=Polychytrium aggregatum TaxID=110093 RepID=UPI0022FF2974|nr:uncharacterized protein BJ171DRAFT_615923 [Polychytrium aggregatum]XP_052967425.1 uncharacterized protein BJ171DRAFT_474291 [Polychytrium aggregatum]KAI9205336.1 hypothetical protein BJ171DRAFT_615923 [Polychytrium aggregatum]KAI9205345.1 hypothetical protein BJ171DRAFT_474291 [Polychytrium aggregatum]
MAESTLIQEDLARFDLLTILITNDAFIHTASPPLLTKLLRVSKQTRAILDTDKIWVQVSLADLQITPEFLFDGVDPSIDRLKVAQGLLCYALRQNQHKPTNSSMLEKENEFWSEVYRDEQLFSRVQRFCQVTDPEFRFPEDARPNSSKQPSVEEMITIAESQNFRSQWPIVVEGAYSVTIRPNQSRDRNTYVSRLLPFDIPWIDGANKRELIIEDVSFLEVSGWPKTLSDISNLAIEHRDWNQVAGSLISLEGMPRVLPMLTRLDMNRCSELASLKGMPEMPKLKSLQLPESIKSLEGTPKELSMLTRLDLSECSELKSLKGMPEMPKLEKLWLPKSIESLEGMPKELPMLAQLDLWRYSELKSLKGLPEMPNLKKLELPKSIESLEDVPKKVLPMLTLLDLRECSELKSLKGMPEMPKLEKLWLPKSIESLEDMPNELPMLERLSLKECNQLKSLEEISEMPHLKALVLPKSIESLEGMPNELPRLTWFDLSECSELKSLKGMPEMPKLVTLKLPKSAESLGGLPRELPSLKLLTSP